jgi:hypothetical protein
MMASTEKPESTKRIATLNVRNPNGPARKIEHRRTARTQKCGHLSAEGERRVSDLMKKRWKREYEDCREEITNFA